MNSIQTILFASDSNDLGREHLWISEWRYINVQLQLNYTRTNLYVLIKDQQYYKYYSTSVLFGISQKLLRTCALAEYHIFSISRIVLASENIMHSAHKYK